MVMKKNGFVKNSLEATMLAMFATMLSVGFTACNDDDDDSQEVAPERTVNYVTPPVQPTEDARTVMITGKTYVFDGSYTDEGRALVERVKTRAASLEEDGVKNIIIHDSRIATLTNAETANLLLQMSQGAALVVADPTAANMKVLAKYLHDVINTYTVGGNNEEARRAVNLILGSRILDRILSWTDSLIDTVFGQDKGKTMSMLALRNEDSYVTSREPQGETETMPVVIYDEKGNVVEEKTVSYVDDSVMNDYHYGIKADNLAAWLDTADEETAAREASRRFAAQLMATRAGGSAEEYLDRISESTDYVIPLGFQLSGPSGHNPYHECNVTYRVWTAYSGEKKCDVYCVTQEVTAYNQMLKCGPSNEKDWYNGSKWGAMDALSKEVSFLSKEVYGPYMSQIKTECVLKDGKLPVKLEEYVPQNSTSGGQTVANSFSFSLGASVSAKAGGPEAGISTSMQWSHSVSKFDADLTMTASPTPDGKVGWTYKGPDPDSHYGLFDNTHESARSIQVNACTVQQGWVWTVKDSKSQHAYLTTTLGIQDKWLAYAILPMECAPHYITQGNSVTVTIAIICPPRYHQKWNMYVESKDLTVEQVEIIENFLTSRLSEYFMPTCVFSTLKPEHKRETKVSDCDEIATFVEKCKEAYDSDGGRKILHEAGTRAQLSETDSYTIVWQQTDIGVNSDREEYTFHMTKTK